MFCMCLFVTVVLLRIDRSMTRSGAHVQAAGRWPLYEEMGMPQ